MKNLKKFRNFISKWIMRVEQASRVIKLGWWMIIGVSTTILAWDFLTTMETSLLLSILIGGTILFAYLYDKYRVLLEKQKKTAWRRTNFLGPRQEMTFTHQRILFEIMGKYLKDENMGYKEYKKVLRNRSEEALEKWRKKGI